MKLNVDCVRDLLITCEELSYNETPDLSAFFTKERLSRYSHEDICYSMEKLCEVGYIDFHVIRVLGGPSFDGIFKNITWSGHEFLNTIKSDTVWSKTKEKVARTVGSASLEIIGAVAGSISTHLLGL